MKHFGFTARKNLVASVAAIAMISSFGFSGVSMAASYSYVDAGDRFYINDFGSDNRRVVVVRKLGNGNIKVRNLASGESFTVRASQLLTQSELDAEELGNALGAGVLVFCILTDSCRGN